MLTKIKIILALENRRIHSLLPSLLPEFLPAFSFPTLLSLALSSCRVQFYKTRGSTGGYLWASSLLSFFDYLLSIHILIKPHKRDHVIFSILVCFYSYRCILGTFLWNYIMYFIVRQHTILYWNSPRFLCFSLQFWITPCWGQRYLWVSLSSDNRADMDIRHRPRWAMLDIR